jgi:ElaB/YqjD/DUF883 family membrane-anchored ribosome-binding protein
MATNNGAVVAGPQAGSARASRKPSSRRRIRKKSRRATRPESGVRARHAAQAALEDWRDDVSEYTEEGQEKVHGLERTLKSFIAEHPLKVALICTSVALAAGAGVWLGRNWLRRDSEPPIPRFPWQ